eukprot:3112266-Alexandrium_andersonii.AAC.1
MQGHQSPIRFVQASGLNSDPQVSEGSAACDVSLDCQRNSKAKQTSNSPAVVSVISWNCRSLDPDQHSRAHSSGMVGGK